MRQVKFGLGFGKRYLLTVVTITMLASPAWAYVRARDGTYHNTLKDRMTKLKSLGWAVSSGRDLPATLPDKTELQNSVNRLVGQALHSLPEMDAAKVSTETKHEIARIAREAIEKAVTGKRDIAKAGQTGSLHYQVGTLWYESYRVQDFGHPGQGRIMGHSSGRAPFVALMPTDRVRSAEARITVLVPADAEVFFESESTTQMGRERHYVTPSLRVVDHYEYTILARWQENGKEIKRSRKVTITGGDSVRVNFLTAEK